MYTALLRDFSSAISAKVFRGEPLSPPEARAFRLMLDALEHQGRQLGTFARCDAAFDTVTGRCGHPPFVVA